MAHVSFSVDSFEFFGGFYSEFFSEVFVSFFYNISSELEDFLSFFCSEIFVCFNSPFSIFSFNLSAILIQFVFYFTIYQDTKNLFTQFNFIQMIINDLKKISIISTKITAPHKYYCPINPQQQYCY
eukprot:TRINITY_DN77851_c0_g1_i1.p1 TRINITY_DN77851_c0_g1~~TRINITY_DN77851_c0_g1_i1.p1  ORF type:complete len:126 (-),score=5.56 TRINITY_DN77851_c0_g1_i1:89-466(-)